MVACLFYLALSLLVVILASYPSLANSKDMSSSLGDVTGVRQVGTSSGRPERGLQRNLIWCG